MEVNQLYPAIMIIVMTGMILGVGILTFDKFADAAKTPTTLNETVTFTGPAGSTTYDEVNSVSQMSNGTASCSAFNSAYACANWTADGDLSINSTFLDDEYYVVYNYDADSTTTTELGNVRDATATISSSWITLIITVVILAIILGMVIRSFGGRR